MEKKDTGTSFWREESGDVSIKGIAVTVAIIVIVGLALVAIQGNLSGWITQIWDLFMGQIEKMTS